MRVLATVHRWWGVVFCLLFAMWFASGIVMHFVPFPARSVTGAATGSVHSTQAARDIVAAYARSHGLDASQASIETIEHDQWTVAGGFNSDRPLFRAGFNDSVGTELYVSSATGNVVLTTTRNSRLANYFGSIVHWIYATPLRHHREAWSAMMWWLSLLATIGATLGVVIGLARLGTGPAYQGLQRWHHISGLIFAPFLLAWIFSGFLSVDDGRVFTQSDALFRALHALDFEPLNSHLWLRTGLIVGLCLCGFAFSLTGMVLALRISRNHAGGVNGTSNSKPTMASR
jgi:hypothetical protein